MAQYEDNAVHRYKEFRKNKRFSNYNDRSTQPCERYGTDANWEISLCHDLIEHQKEKRAEQQFKIGNNQHNRKSYNCHSKDYWIEHSKPVPPPVSMVPITTMWPQMPSKHPKKDPKPKKDPEYHHGQQESQEHGKSRLVK